MSFVFKRRGIYEIDHLLLGKDDQLIIGILF
ncbi:hypothetical protein L950_0216650 [Sphingobacterium sp. IITKGP-BTPF85]|nr:hypothetical protein L950_0216650 [Sphingobacterium sp. IITKGP-BTPF85]